MFDKLISLIRGESSTPAAVAARLKSLEEIRRKKTETLDALRDDARSLRVESILGRKADESQLKALAKDQAVLEEELESLETAIEATRQALHQAAEEELNARRTKLEKRGAELAAERAKWAKQAAFHLAGLAVALAKLGCEALVEPALTKSTHPLLSTLSLQMLALRDSATVPHAWAVDHALIAQAASENMWKAKPTLHDLRAALSEHTNEISALERHGIRAIEARAMEAAGAVETPSSHQLATMHADGTLRCAGKSCQSRKLQRRNTEGGALVCSVCGMSQDAPPNTPPSAFANIGISHQTITPPEARRAAYAEPDINKVLIGADGKPHCSRSPCWSRHLAKSVENPEKVICISCGHMMEAPPAPPAAPTPALVNS
ncbi:MAG: hypothetical protein AMXMBFR7_47610 [Planctomycetota bacterium]